MAIDTVTLLSVATHTVGFVCLGLGAFKYALAMREPEDASAWRNAAQLTLVAGSNLAIAMSLGYFQGTP